MSKSSLKEADRFAELTCPDELTIKTSTIAAAGKGVFASERLEKNTYFGPYGGKRHHNVQSAQESGYAWSIADKDGKVAGDEQGRDHLAEERIDAFHSRWLTSSMVEIRTRVTG